MKDPRASEYLVFVGTYTGGRSEAIFSFRMSGETGVLEPLSVTSGFHNPSFLGSRAARTVPVRGERGQ